MSVFKLQSDNQFIRTLEGSSDIQIFEYMDDIKAFELIHASSSRWRTPIPVGPSAAARFKKLEVRGVTIEGSQLTELVKDLTWIDLTGRRFYPSVNRQGLCLMLVGCEQIKRVRINDHFGWSKYGVKPVISTIWSIWDMSNGAVLVAPPAMSIDHGGENADHDGNKYSVLYESWKKVLEEKDKVIEEKDKVMEKTESLLRKSLEEKEKENVSLKAALKALSSTDDHV